VLAGIADSAASTVTGAAPGTPWSGTIADNNDRATSYSNGAIAAFAVGGALAVAGGALIGVGYRKERRIALAPSFIGNGAAMSIGGAF
jgi:hypothetical protein